ncbi:hypothetical protein J809_1598 [Acinetobacter sp. 25977_6]|nr:hypothetical protein J514_2523 [Acinetobacter sp. 1396970]EXS44184.1 hypothetical protein J660_2874 [Acinetobacter sp. 88816]EXT40631.1 hypothetical protein J811_0448 [Acinetobacter sp. 25977_8]EXT45043.1 hypothetical protein J810_1543 [Acinetobacter sp. 25977_7]EXT46175.1 hypothetical protein J809_1598 [Acinetobacter sp. 25977_6]EXT55263.1 hypothetical protein J806_2029 [Acinetobacter sp. 25977_3]EXT58927.1 hypothetical protein J805_1964 [Acinetobacter sp. 25977_2]EXT62286.1 hypothetical
MILLSLIGLTNYDGYLMIDLTNICVYDAICGLRNNICT